MSLALPEPGASGRPADAADAGGSAFPTTRFSIVRATASDDAGVRREAWDALVRAYWKPVYKFVRIQWRASEQDAQDLTQEFFARAIEAGFFDDYQPARARFRTYLRVCLQRFLSNEHKSALRQKRGGGAHILPLDFAGAEQELHFSTPGGDVDGETYFRQESVRALLAQAVDDLREHCDATGRTIRFTVFSRYDLHDAAAGDRPTYQQLATFLDLPVTQVTNHLAWARREFRTLVLARLREISGSEEEFRREALELLGVSPPS